MKLFEKLEFGKIICKLGFGKLFSKSKRKKWKNDMWPKCCMQKVACMEHFLLGAFWRSTLSDVSFFSAVSLI